MQLHVTEATCRQLELCCVEEEARHPEPDLPVQRIICAARQDAGTRAVLAGGRFHRYAVRVNLYPRHARAALDDDPRQRRALEEILIERTAIDDDSFDPIAGVHHFVPGGRREPRSRQLVQQ